MNIDIRSSTAAVPEAAKKISNDLELKDDHPSKSIDQGENLSHHDQLHSSTNGKIRTIYSIEDQQVHIERDYSTSTEICPFISLRKEVKKMK